MESSQKSDPSTRLTTFVSRFLRGVGHEGRDFRISSLAGDGSKRHFWRIHLQDTEITYVAMQNEPQDRSSARENRAYLLIGKHLQARSIPVPEIYRGDPESGFFIMEDLGDLNLQEGSRRGDPLVLYREVLRVLLRMQMDGAVGFQPEWTCQTEKYDRTVMRRYEADYFKEAFLCRYLGFQSEWPQLQSSLDLIAEEGSRAPSHFFLHRDFQSRNIMISEGRIGIIDWQGARLGPLGYDVASLIIDPYTDFSLEQRAGIYRSYLSLLRESEPAHAGPFEDSYPYLALQRNLQILGAFSHLSKVVGKTYFEAYIPKALESLRLLLEGIPGNELRPLLDVVCEAAERLTHSA